MAQICELWNKLHVPLSYRSHFYLQFRDKEPIHLSMELHRMKNRMQQLQKQADTVMEFHISRTKAVEKAKRALEVSVAAWGMSASWYAAGTLGPGAQDWSMLNALR